MRTFNFDLESIFVTDSSVVTAIKDENFGTGDNRVMLARNILEWYQNGSLKVIFTSEGATFIAFNASVLQELAEIASEPLTSELLAIENENIFGYQFETDKAYDYGYDEEIFTSLKPYTTPKYRVSYNTRNTTSKYFSNQHIANRKKARLYFHALGKRLKPSRYI